MYKCYMIGGSQDLSVFVTKDRRTYIQTFRRPDLRVGLSEDVPNGVELVAEIENYVLVSQLSSNVLIYQYEGDMRK